MYNQKPYIEPVGPTRKEILKRIHGRRIAEIRRREGLTQAKLAEQMDKDIKTISRVENGDHFLPPDDAMKLYEEYGYLLDWIYGISEMPKTEDLVYQVDIRDLIQISGKTVSIAIKPRLLKDLKHCWSECIADLDPNEETARFCTEIERQRRCCHLWNNGPAYYRATISLKDFVLRED